MNRYRAGQPAEPPIQPIEYAGEEPDESMVMLAYMIVALLLVCATIGIGFIVGRYFS
jgi:hypothetical protein